MSIRKREHEEIFNKTIEYLNNNGEPGRELGFSVLNEFYSHKQGGVTDWTGFPGSGKTYFCLECLFNLSEQYGKRHGLYIPDVGSDPEIMAKLIKMRCGMDFTNKYGNKISEKKLAQEMDWILHHFILLGKEDFKVGITPIAFFEYIGNYKDDGGKLDTGLIDSWKNMKHIYLGREDSYLDEQLSIRNEISEQAKVHFHTVAHAVKTEADNSGKRRVPTAWDIKGGGSWYANGKSIITVDFPDKTKNGVDLYINKVKPEDVGRVGYITGKLFLDKTKGRYYEMLGHNKPGYAYEYLKYQPAEQVGMVFTTPSGQVPQGDDLPF